MNEITTHDDSYKLMEKVISEGDLSLLTSQERLIYYNKICESMNLNPLTRPFEYIKLQGKLVLYARKDATEQLRKINKISITDLKQDINQDVLVITAYAKNMDGTQDIATGAVNIKGLMGNERANAFMKAETKAKRRVTLSLCGLGFTDESEIETIKDVQKIEFNKITGEVKKELAPIKDDIILYDLQYIKDVEELENYYKSLPKSMKKKKIIDAFSDKKKEILIEEGLYFPDISNKIEEKDKSLIKEEIITGEQKEWLEHYNKKEE